MYKKVMVPLDGSKLAECVLPHLDALAKGCQAESVTLVRVQESVRIIAEAEAGITDKQWQMMTAQHKEEAQEYITKLLGRLKYDNVKVNGVVLDGPVAEALSDYATKNDFDLIIIATHGRSGVSRWVWGSVAERLLRSACVPVFMVRAPGCVPGV